MAKSVLHRINSTQSSMKINSTDNCSSSLEVVQERDRYLHSSIKAKVKILRLFYVNNKLEQDFQISKHHLIRQREN